ncbi:MAG TPA: hypothetical protein VF433_02725 [Cellvibrio sp.]
MELFAAELEELLDTEAEEEEREGFLWSSSEQPTNNVRLNQAIAAIYLDKTACFVKRIFDAPLGYREGIT